MATTKRTKIFPFLWYNREAEEAARFYASIFPDSRVDRVTAMLSESPSGQPQACGWLIDRFGLRWQIVPTVMDEMMNDKDPARSKRATDAMMQMIKFDIAALQRAYHGQG